MSGSILSAFASPPHDRWFEDYVPGQRYRFSGWHTASLVMRVLVDHYVSLVAGLSSPGIDELRWLAPVRPGDVLTVGVDILEARRSRSKPDRGIVTARVTAYDESDQPVMTLQAVNLFASRPV